MLGLAAPRLASRRAFSAEPPLNGVPGPDSPGYHLGLLSALCLRPAWFLTATEPLATTSSEMGVKLRVPTLGKPSSSRSSPLENHNRLLVIPVVNDPFKDVSIRTIRH